MADFLQLSTSTVLCCKLVIACFFVVIWRWCLRVIWNISFVQNAIVCRDHTATILRRTTHLSNQNFVMVPTEQMIQTPAGTITTRGTVIRLLLSIQKRTEPSSVYNTSLLKFSKLC